jgi:hypothetical protein
MRMQTFIEIVCDESGFSGTNLLDPDNRVFTHASVDLDTWPAGELVAEVRARFPSSAVEYKSGRLPRPALHWLLGPSGPLTGHAHVHLVDKSLFVVHRLVDLLTGEPRYVSGTSLDRDQRSMSMAAALHRLGPVAYGPGPWQTLLQALVALLRSKRRWMANAQVDVFFGTVAELRRPGQPDEVMELLWQARPRIDLLRTSLLHDPKVPPPLEPLIPALLETARYWCAGGRPVSIVHDEQSALTQNRIRQIQRLLDGRLSAVRRVDSRSDPRVQVADFLAGAARRIASAELRGQGDNELTALLRPYVNPYSIWADRGSGCWPLRRAQCSPVEPARTRRLRDSTGGDSYDFIPPFLG